MTVGEKIQKYRKDLGLSQEELGQKLLVSRQTVSLWEKDQTVPTIDNLIRLKYIFGVSVDEILDTQCPNKTVEDATDEIYKIVFTKSELKEMHRKKINALFKKPVISLIIYLFIIIFFIGTSAPEFLISIMFGILLTCITLNIITIRNYNKLLKDSIDRICQTTYQYKIFKEYMIVTTYHNSEVSSEIKCYFANIKQIYDLGKWIDFQCNGQLFIIRKEDLKKDSFFNYFLINSSTKKRIRKPFDKWSFFSIVLFIASLLSIWMALALVSIVNSDNHMVTENFWLFFLLTPIPISSIIYGIILKQKGIKFRKNIIIGIIITVILCIYGSFSFIFSGVYDHSDKPIIRVEQTLDIDLPQHKNINTQDFTIGSQTTSRGYVYYVSDVYFDNDIANKFEQQIATDEKWLPSVPSNLVGITSPIVNFTNHDFTLIYNSDTSEFNTLPDDNGKFRFISLMYNTDKNLMYIVEYDIDFVK